MASTSSAELTSELRARIEAKINSNVAETAYLQGVLKSLQELPPLEDTMTHAVPPVASIPEAAPQTLQQLLIHLAREHGVVAISKLPNLFKARHWEYTSDEALTKDANTVVKGNKSVFEMRRHGYFRLAEARKNGLTGVVRGISKKPLSEYAYDCLSMQPKKTAPAKLITEYAKAQGYVEQKTPISTLLSQIMVKDKRFQRVRTGVWRLK